MAEGSGTMNNVHVRQRQYQYYETVASSARADGFDDRTWCSQDDQLRLTDPEVLEWRYPVRLQSYASAPAATTRPLARRDGGTGGIRFLEPRIAVATLASDRRVPPSACTAAPAPCSRWIERLDGTIDPDERLRQQAPRPGDVFVIETGRRKGSAQRHPERERVPPDRFP